MGMEAADQLIPVEALIPEKGYLRSYVDYGTSVTMAPPEYHLVCGLAQMGALMGNRVSFALGGHLYPPHLWIVLLGRAGAKKSSAINLATSLLDEATEGKLRLPQEQTREALWASLVERPTGYLALSELMAFLERCKRDYMAGIQEDLCDLFDAPLIRERKLKQSSYTVKRPAITILGRAVTDVFTSWIRSKDIAGGFLSRFVFVPQVSDVDYIGMIAPEDNDRSRIAQHLRDLAGFVPVHPSSLSFPPDARQAWEEYDQEQHRLDYPEELSGFQNRVGVYAAKLTLCFALAEETLIPTVEHVERAGFFMEWAKSHLQRLMLLGAGVGRDGEDIKRLMRIIQGSTQGGGWAPREAILRRSGLLASRLDQLLTTMTESLLLEERHIATGGRPRREVRPTKLSRKGPVSAG